VVARSIIFLIVLVLVVRHNFDRGSESLEHILDLLGFGGSHNGEKQENDNVHVGQYFRSRAARLGSARGVREPANNKRDQSDKDGEQVAVI